MEENRAEKKPVSIRLSAFTQERFQKTLESYKNSADDRRDQQENALIRMDFGKIMGEFGWFL